jgi:hypothetical protein
MGEARMKRRTLHCARIGAALVAAIGSSLYAHAADFLDGYKITVGDFRGDGTPNDLFVSSGRRIVMIPVVLQPHAE